MECSKGTYIRTLCEDIAQKLGTIGYMKDLQRTKFNEFDLTKSTSLNELEKSNILEKIISVEKIFLGNEKIEIDNTKQ